jgi:CheY-like chemotaxis protein
VARILIVEDEFSDQLLLFSIFQGRGHEIFTAGDGEAALATYAKRDIQLIITDLQMPNVDGLELIERVLAHDPNAAIIAVSGKGPEFLAEVEAMNLVAVLSKPVDPGALLGAVNQVVGPERPGDSSSYEQASAIRRTLALRRARGSTPESEPEQASPEPDESQAVMERSEPDSDES